MFIYNQKLILFYSTELSTYLKEESLTINFRFYIQVCEFCPRKIFWFGAKKDMLDKIILPYRILTYVLEKY